MLQLLNFGPDNAAEADKFIQPDVTRIKDGLDSCS
jgi:hypothetical protein